MQQNKGIHRMRQQPRGVGSMCNSVARYICNLVSRIPNLYAGIGRAVASIRRYIAHDQSLFIASCHMGKYV